MDALNARIIAICTFFFLALLPCPALLFAAEELDTEHWIITADRIVRYENPASIIAEGEVILEKKEPDKTSQRPKPSQWDDLLGPDAEAPRRKEPGPSGLVITTVIKADWAAYDVAREQVRARGNVHIQTLGDELFAESGIIRMKDQTGLFENTTIIREDKDLHLEGRVVEKTGELTYHIEDGWVITCKLQDGESPPWSIGAEDTSITDGGYALLKNAIFRVKGIPVFYSPYLLLPAKHERQTGLLFPSLSLSDRDGFGMETPFFINLLPMADITLYPKYMSERGFMLGGEFRYALDEDSKGMILGHYLDDSLSKPSETAYYHDGNYTHSNRERYWIRGKFDQSYGDWIARLDLDVVSDEDYLREFSNDSTDFAANNHRFFNAFGRGFKQKLNLYRENTLELLRSGHDGTALTVEFMGVNDVSEDLYGPDNPSRFWRLPTLTYSGLKPLSTYRSYHSDISWDASYSNFWRDEGVSAQRLDLFPELSMNLPLGRYLESSIRGGIRETFYLLDDGGATEWKDKNTVNRWLYRLGGEVATTLYREYGEAPQGGSGLGHTVRPFVEYQFQDIPDTDKVPFFDEVEELRDTNALYYGVNNFFSLFSGGKDGQSERDLFFVKLRHGYDLRGDVSDKPFLPVELKAGVYPVEGARLIYKAELDVYGEGVEHSLEADYRNNRGDIFALDYRFDDRQNINSVSGVFWYQLPYNFAVGYSLERDIENQATVEEKFRLLYQPACWSVELAGNHAQGDKTIMVIFRLANIGSPLGFSVGGFKD